MIIYERIDDEIIIDDKIYHIDASFNNILNIIDIIEDKRLSDENKVDTTLFFFIEDKLENKTIREKEKILKTILEKYIQDDTDVEYDLLGNVMPKKQQEKYFDYREDSDYIFSSFYQVYGIDLIQEQGKLHWLKFKALLNGLPDKSKLMNVISIRAWNPADEKKSHKQVMTELQRKYSLKGGANE